jgi:uncharacterized damage-inducible protein DinB
MTLRTTIECSRTTMPGPTAAFTTRQRGSRATNIVLIAAPSSNRSTKSVHGTLNHLLVTDRIWMQRFTGEGDAPTRLDAILFETFDELRAAREAEDRRILRFVEGLDDRRIEGTIKYRRVSSPDEFEQQVAPALAHWFNHQTHHRGQVHALLTGLLGQAPELDLLYFQRLAARPAA